MFLVVGVICVISFCWIDCLFCCYCVVKMMVFDDMLVEFMLFFMVILGVVLLGNMFDS